MTNTADVLLDQIAELQAQIRDLTARRDITDALHRYMRGQDRLDPLLHRSAFHDGAYVDCGLLAGPVDDFIDFAQGFLAQLEACQHIIGQAHLDIRGDEASGEVYFCAQHRMLEDGRPTDLFVAGRYIDEYACIGGDWRIVKRREIVDWARSDPATDGFLDANPMIPRGGRKGSDFSDTRDWPA